jgi:hypothetical protein
MRRAEALLDLGRLEEADAALAEALQGAAEHDVLPLAWRVHFQRAQLRQLQGRPEAASEAAAARAIVHELAARVPDEALRRNFLAQTAARLETLAGASAPPGRSTANSPHS